MGNVAYFFWLGAQAFGLPALFPPAGFLMFGGAVATAVAVSRVPTGCWRQVLAAILIPVAVPAAILLCGVLLATMRVCTQRPRCGLSG
jgi:hypothetical protein